MNCLQSLWTGTPMFRPQRGPLLVHTLALCMAKEHFQAVELVTDTRGLHLSELMGWRYTSYLNVLDALTAAGLTHVWALGKLAAIREQNRPFLQIDTDVLLLKAPRREIRHARIAAQSIDYPDYYAGADMRAALDKAGLPAGGIAYNCGVIGGTDLALLHWYAQEGMEMAAKFHGNELNGTTTSMAVEQYHLGEFARRHGVRVETILPLHHAGPERRHAGYAHLTGDNKRDPVLVAACERRLARDFPAEYRAFLAGWKRVQRDGVPDTGTAVKPGGYPV